MAPTCIKHHPRATCSSKGVVLIEDVFARSWSLTTLCAFGGFNYNKLRAMLISRVRVGVQLDSDQFVAPGSGGMESRWGVLNGRRAFVPLHGPGADYMFNMTEREITREYPIPILPVHYFSHLEVDSC